MRKIGILPVFMLPLFLLFGCSCQNKAEEDLKGSQIFKAEEGVEIVADGIENMEDSVWFYSNDKEMSEDAKDAITRKVEYVKKDYAFCNVKGCTITTTYRKDGYNQTEILLRYYMSPEQYQYVETQVETLGKSFKRKTDIETYKAIYTWICTNIEYDYDTVAGEAERFSAYDALKDRKAVCYGYAALFQKFCDYLDLPCFVLTSADDTAHAWNVVAIEDQYYHVDCTFGSVAGGADLDYFLCGQDRITYGTAYGIKLAKKSITFDEDETSNEEMKQKVIQEEIDYINDTYKLPDIGFEIPTYE